MEQFEDEAYNEEDTGFESSDGAAPISKIGWIATDMMLSYLRVSGEPSR